MSRYSPISIIIVPYLIWQVIKVWREKRKQSWPVVEGRISGNYVFTEMSEDMQRTPELCYSYQVNGQSYYGAQQIIETDFHAYPVGSLVRVRYNPSDPSISCLDQAEMIAREDTFNASENSGFSED